MSIFKTGTYGHTMEMNRREYGTIIKKLLALRTPDGLGSSRAIILEAVHRLRSVEAEFLVEMVNQTKYHPEDFTGAEDANPKS